MKRLFQLSFVLLLSSQAFGQMILTAPGITPENICTPNTVYFLMTDKAKPVEKVDSIEVRLNNTIDFAKKNPTFKASVALQGAVNCKGECGGGVHIVDGTKNEEWDKKLVDFFKTINQFQVGKYKGAAVDSWYMWRLEIKDGKMDITNRN